MKLNKFYFAIVALVANSTQSTSSVRERIYCLVRCIPEGYVATYREVAEMAGLETTDAQVVGTALKDASKTVPNTVPWWRVIKSKDKNFGCISEGAPENQRQRLEDEDVRLDDNQIDLSLFGWKQMLENESVKFDVNGRLDFASFEWGQLWEKNQ